jgi:predicted DsbA family dithiol-disulfide isomerase
MEIVLKVYFDYASPICYIGYKVLERLSQEFSIEWCWKGVQIYPGGNPAWSDSRNRKRMTAKVQRIASEAEVEVKLPRHWINSRPALEGAEYAKEAGKFPAYHRAVFEACFQQGRDIGKAWVLCEIAEEMGLDSEGLLNCLHSRRIADIIGHNSQEARREEATGFPALMLDSFPLIGAHPYETMKLHLERYFLVLSRRKSEKR